MVGVALLIRGFWEEELNPPGPDQVYDDAAEENNETWFPAQYELNEEVADGVGLLFTVIVTFVAGPLHPAAVANTE